MDIDWKIDRKETNASFLDCVDDNFGMMGPALLSMASILGVFIVLIF